MLQRQAIHIKLVHIHKFDIVAHTYIRVMETRSSPSTSRPSAFAPPGNLGKAPWHKRDLQDSKTRADDDIVLKKSHVVTLKCGAKKQIRLPEGLPSWHWRWLETTLANVGCTSNERGYGLIFHNITVEPSCQSKVFDVIGFEHAAKFCLLQYLHSTGACAAIGEWLFFKDYFFTKRPGVSIDSSAETRRKKFSLLKGPKYTTVSLTKELTPYYRASLQKYNLVKYDNSSKAGPISLATLEFPSDPLVEQARLNFLKRLDCEDQVKFSTEQIWGTGVSLMDYFEESRMLHEVIKGVFDAVLDSVVNNHAGTKTQQAGKRALRTEFANDSIEKEVCQNLLELHETREKKRTRTTISQGAEKKEATKVEEVLDVKSMAATSASASVPGILHNDVNPQIDNSSEDSTRVVPTEPERLQNSHLTEHSSDKETSAFLHSNQSEHSIVVDAEMHTSSAEPTTIVAPKMPDNGRFQGKWLKHEYKLSFQRHKRGERVIESPKTWVGVMIVAIILQCIQAWVSYEVAEEVLWVLCVVTGFAFVYLLTHFRAGTTGVDLLLVTLFLPFGYAIDKNYSFMIEPVLMIASAAQIIVCRWWWANLMFTVVLLTFTVLATLGVWVLPGLGNFSVIHYLVLLIVFTNRRLQNETNVSAASLSGYRDGFTWILLVSGTVAMCCHKF